MASRFSLLVTHTQLDVAQAGGQSTSGNSKGGDAAGSNRRNRKRSTDPYTAGGNAYSGNTGNTDGGNVYNDAGTGAVSNTGGSELYAVSLGLVWLLTNK